MRALSLSIRCILFASRHRSGIFHRPASTRRAMSAPNRIDLCGTADVAPGTAIRVEAGDLALAGFNLDGGVCVTDDACTPGPGPLSGGFIEGDRVGCTF